MRVSPGRTAKDEVAQAPAPGVPAVPLSPPEAPIASIRIRQTSAGTTYDPGPRVNANAVVTVWVFDAANDTSQSGTATRIAEIKR